MSLVLAAFDDLVAEAVRAASAFDGSRLDKLVGALCAEVDTLERAGSLRRDELLRVQGKLCGFVKLCEGLHQTLFAVLEGVVADAQPPTYAHLCLRAQSQSTFSQGYVRRYG